MTETAPGFPKLDKQTRVWVCKHELPGCTRTQPCAHCRGRRSRRSGLKKQREVRKTIERQTGTQAGRYASQTGNEENWRTSIRVEAKSGKQVQATATAYTKARDQSDASCSIGDNRPFVLASVPNGWPAGKFLYTVHSDDAEAFAEALLA